MNDTNKTFQHANKVNFDFDIVVFFEDRDGELKEIETVNASGFVSDDELRLVIKDAYRGTEYNVTDEAKRKIEDLIDDGKLEELKAAGEITCSVMYRHSDPEHLQF